MSIATALAAHAHLDASAIPAVARQRARTRVMDGLGCLMAGYAGEGSTSLVDMVRSWGGTPEAKLPGTGLAMPAPNVAMAGAALMRTHDFEPVEADGPGGTTCAAHITGTTVPVALAVGQLVGASGAQMLDALIIGDDLAARLAVASGFDVYSGQDNTGTVNAVGATAIAARLLGLGQEETVAAFGLAINQMAGTVAAIYDAANAFRLPMAFAARNAITSALLAQGGWRAADDPFEGRHGFFDTQCADPKPPLVVDGLGQEFHGDAVIKPWSSCRASHPSLNAAVECHSRISDPAAITSIAVHVTPRTAGGFVGADFRLASSPEASAAFSIPYTTARALLSGTMRPWHMTRQAVTDPAIEALLDKLTVVPSLDPAQRLTAEVEVRTSEGTHHVRIDSPAGDIRTAPLSADQILDKFVSNCHYGRGIDSAQARDIAETITSIDTVDDVTELFTLMDKE